VIWIGISADLTFEQFYWLGGAPDERLPTIGEFRSAKGRRNKEGTRLDRPNHFYVPDNLFVRLDTLHDVLLQLFGP